MITLSYASILWCTCFQLTSRKSSSTPSLNEVSESRQSVASTEQAASAENLTAAVKAVSLKNTLLLLVWTHDLYLLSVSKQLEGDKSLNRTVAVIVVEMWPVFSLTWLSSRTISQFY